MHGMCLFVQPESHTRPINALGTGMENLPKKLREGSAAEEKNSVPSKLPEIEVMFAASCLLYKQIPCACSVPRALTLSGRIDKAFASL